MPSDHRPDQAAEAGVISVCVFCSSSVSIDAKYLELATEVGRRIGQGGHRLVSGGGRVSMMGAVASAARAHGAHTLGVIPQHLLGYEVADDEADELVVVETMRERKRQMDEAADCFVVLPGGIGTLEEFFEAWTSFSLDMHAKPVIVLDPFGFYQPLWDFIASMIETGFVRDAAWSGLQRVTSVDEAFALIDALA